MSHLYDNPDLSFSKMKDIFSKATKGELVGTEKTDGQNLFVSYSVRDKKAKAARNKSNIKAGGLDPSGLAQKFAGRGNLERAFVDGFDAFEQAVQSMPIELQIDLFGPDANIFYNAEIMDPRSPNVVNYDTKNLVIHRVGHLAIDKESGETVPVESEELVSQLEQALGSIQASKEEEDYGVQVNAVKNLQKFTSDKPTMKIIKRLDDLMRADGLSDSNVVGDYVVKKVGERIEENFPSASKDIRDMILRRVLGQKGSNLTKILAKIPKEETEYRDSVRSFVNQSKDMIKEIIYPLEDIIHDFSVLALSGLESVFVLDNQREVERLRKEVATAIRSIEGSGSEEAMTILNKQLQKLKSIDNVSTASEGFVFDYDGKTYKFTGNFAPINQLLGLFRFGRGDIPPMKKIDEEREQFNRIVSVFPGKFKPPHAGHLGAVEEMYPTTEEMYILISPREDKGVTAEASKKIWDIYLNRYGLAGKAQAFVSTQLFPDAPSPVQATYEFIEEFVEAGDKVILVLGQKDIKDGRYTGAMRVGQNKGVDVEIQPIPPQAGGISASGDMKPAMEAGDEQKFKKLLPPKLNPEDKDRIWKLVKGDVSEISTAAAVVGYSGDKDKDEKEESYMITREDIIYEEKVREVIRKKIEKQAIALSEAIAAKEKDVIYVTKFQKDKMDNFRLEHKLKECIHRLLLQEKEELPPHRSTGINVLQVLLKTVVSSLKTGYKSLTTDIEQRRSFRSHIINAVVNSLAPIELDDEAGQELKEIDVDIKDDIPADADKFIDVGDEDFASDEEEKESFQTLPGEDLTGRNVAMQSYDRIEKQIVDAYADLDNQQDQKMFYDYLIANLKLYFDRFEDQLQDELPEPSNIAYEKEKEEEEMGAAMGETPSDEGIEELEEIYSDKQRKWACAQTKGNRKSFKGKASLSPKEADEMCSADVKK